MKEKSFLRCKMIKKFACGGPKRCIFNEFWFKIGQILVKSPPKGAKNLGVEFFLILGKAIKKHCS